MEFPSNTQEAEPQDYRAGFVSLLGRPNVGKSTLINALLEQDITAVSFKPQTTRKRQLGILTLDDAQIVFEDTPGIHHPHHKLGECMNQEALDSLAEADLVAWMVDASRPPNDEDELLAGLLRRSPLPPGHPLILILNKIDLAGASVLDEYRNAYLQLAPPGALPVMVSATAGDGLAELVQILRAQLPIHPPFFPPDQLTDVYERDIAADLIRASALSHLREEVPYSIAVRIDEYRERERGALYIAATLLIERESQKGIVIGKGGQMLKQIGSTARQSIETMTGIPVFLELRVKVRPDWRNDPAVLRQFGFDPDKVTPLE